MGQPDSATQSLEALREVQRGLLALQNEPGKAMDALVDLGNGYVELLSNEETLSRAKVFLQSLIHSLSGTNRLFALAICAWLTEEKFLQLGKMLLGEQSVRYLQTSSIPAYDLTGVDESQAILCAYRFCASAESPALCLGWTFAIESSFKDSSTARQAVEELLRHMAEEYPTTSLRLLSAAPDDAKSQLATEIERALQEEKAELDALPWLRELGMTSEMKLANASIRRRFNREVERGAAEESIFAQLFKTQRFKYSHSTAVEFEVEGEVREQTLQMASHQVSVELPVSEGTDPLLGKFRRNAMWSGRTR
jgi:hypothetical protein